MISRSDISGPRAGVSLFETMVSLAILSLIVAVVATSIRPPSPRLQEAATLSQLVRAAQENRLRAIQEGRAVRMVTGLLNSAGCCVNHKRLEPIWRREGLKVPQKQKKKGRLWLKDGSCVRLRAERPNHVWSYDCMQDRTADGRVHLTLNIRAIPSRAHLR